MFEIGNSLREARVRRGIEFAQAEQATKIRVKYLRALEEERFDLLPSETYVKGFVRAYAEYLGLDGQLYVDEFNSRFATAQELRPRRGVPVQPDPREAGDDIIVGRPIRLLELDQIGDGNHRQDSPGRRRPFRARPRGAETSHAGRAAKDVEVERPVPEWN